VQIESGQVADKTWHRVLVGPFVSREQLAGAQKQLANNGFHNLLLQQRKGP
jgi:cell division protein FtsN